MAETVVGGSPEEREAALAEGEARTADIGEDFDTFWSTLEQEPVVLRNVFGADVVLEPGLPLKFQVMSERLKDEQTEAALHEMIALVFGRGVLDTWIDNGVTHEQLMVLFMWGISNRKTPGSMTLQRAYELHRQHTADQGKAEQAPTPQTTSGAGSAGTGGRSKPTSRASTASRKTTSRPSRRAAS